MIGIIFLFFLDLNRYFSPERRLLLTAISSSNGLYHIGHFSPINFGIIAFLYVLMGLFKLNLFLRLGMPLGPRTTHILRQLFHDLFEGLDMLFFLFNSEVGFIEGLSKLEHLVEEFLSL